MKRSVEVSGENFWKCCECETEWPMPSGGWLSEEINDEINEVDYLFTDGGEDEIVTVLVCNKCMYKLNPELLKEIR